MVDTQALAAALMTHYGLEVSSIVIMRTVYGVVTRGSEKYIWKFVRGGESVQRLLSLQPALDYLAQFEIDNAGPIATLHGERIAYLKDGTVGYLQPWLPGRHVNLGERQERLMAVATIAHMHRSFAQVKAAGVLPVELPTPGGQLPARLRAKQVALRRSFAVAKTQFPDLAEVEQQIFSAADSVADLFAQPYFLPEDGYKVLCHRDLAPHNMLWHDRKIALIDFDRAGLDDPFTDFMQIANHSLFSCTPESSHFADMVAVYTRIHPLSERRLNKLWQLLYFPDVLIRTLAEWVKNGCPDEKRDRLIAAVQSEQQRWAVLEQNDSDRVRSPRAIGNAGF
ncbi:aminoglycoside phosphotransferase family protein [Alicyclobacillus tolerans]|uniref:aminoglycoside phosphotransferase family protein n=1 Tax=Alicyclobacillus tolerans TaxID=90970 RepID=UPI001F294212|nr:aminoglycoside phosphotransferase family protein [Alicyclobacillus tolerans]MCF8565209.1 aminoglycoside phosphotransferase family protein [Alicyclobacillus tolerans]